AWVVWLGAGYRFAQPLARDPVEQTASADAVLGFVPGPSAQWRPPAALRHLALLFTAAEERQRTDADFASPFPKNGEGPLKFIAVSNELTVMNRDAFRSGVLKRFADWTAEFGKQERLCRWGAGALRSLQASVLVAAKRHLVQLG
ncbi:unnamed protein product, partial [Symbiodinium pilosum]